MSFIIYVIILALAVGSFLNVVIYRLPKITKNEWAKECHDFLNLEYKDTDEKFSLSFPSSHCPVCKNKLRFWHNIPVISYLFLGAKCAFCKTPISFRYPFIELLSGVLCGYIAYHYGFSVQTLSAIVFTWLLIAMSMIDFDHQLLLDNLTIPLLWLGLLVNSFDMFTSLTSSVYGAMAGYMVLWSVFWVFKLITQKEGMGYGDFKLLAALGAWCGWQSLLLILIISSVVSIIVSIVLKLFKQRDMKLAMPFGPSLAIAGWIALLWGDQIITWYLSTMMVAI